MKNRKYLSEQDFSGNNPCRPYTGDLKTACESNCLPSTARPHDTQNGVVAKGQSKKTGRWFIIYNEYKPGGLKMEIFSDEYKTLIQDAPKTLLCDELERIQNAAIGPEIERAVKIITAYTGDDQVIPYKEGMDKEDLIKQGFALTKLQDLPGYDTFKTSLSDMLNKRANTIFYWLKKSPRQYQGDAATDFLYRWTAAGWSTDKPEGGINNEDYEYKELHKLPNSPFKEPYIVYRLKRSQSENDEIEQLKNSNEAVKIGVTAENCRALVKGYIRAYKRSLIINQGDLDIMKRNFSKCILRFKFPFLNDKIKKLKYAPLVRSGTNTANYALASIQNENMDNRIKNILRESLSEIKQLKKKSLTEERVLSNKGFSLLFEQFSNKKRLNEDVFFEALFKEINSQKRQGLSDKIIEEELFDSIKNMPWFSGIFGGLKEMLVKWIINKFVPGGENTQIGQFIAVALANLELSEIPKLLTNCKSLTEWLTKSIIESIIAKFGESKGVSGGIVDVLRNTIMETLDSSQFYDTMEDKLSGVICSAFGGLKSKVQDIAQSGEETAQGNA